MNRLLLTVVLCLSAAVSWANPPCNTCVKRAVVVNHAPVVAKAVHYNQVPIVQPLWQVGHHLQQEAGAEYQFRLSPSQHRLTFLEGYHDAMETAKALAAVQAPGQFSQGSQQQTIGDRYPIFTQNCLGCHNGPQSDGGLLFDPNGVPDEGAIKRMLDRVYLGEMPPEKCLTPADYVALEAELGGSEVASEEATEQPPSGGAVKWGATGPALPQAAPAATPVPPAKPAPESASQPNSTPPAAPQGSTKSNSWKVELAISRPD